MAKILLVDDHPVVREGLGHVLSAALPGVTIGAADAAGPAFALMATEPWDLVILDLALGRDDGTMVLRQMRQAHPKVPVLVISMHPADQFERRVVQAGAIGYVTKGSAPEDLVRAVRAALEGTGRGPAPAAEPPGGAGLPHETLSDREYQVLRMIGQGQTVSAIAAELSLSVKTVSTYRARIMEKTGMRTNAELMRYVLTHHLVP